MVLKWALWAREGLEQELQDNTRFMFDLRFGYAAPQPTSCLPSCLPEPNCKLSCPFDCFLCAIVAPGICQVCSWSLHVCGRWLFHDGASIRHKSIRPRGHCKVSRSWNKRGGQYRQLSPARRSHLALPRLRECGLRAALWVLFVVLSASLLLRHVSLFARRNF